MTRRPTAGRVHFAANDFTKGTLAAELQRAGHRADAATMWVWEGVVPYATAAQVTASVIAIAARSPQSRLVINCQMPSATASMGRLVGRVMMRLARSPDPWSEEPHRSDWTAQQMSSLLDTTASPR